MVKRILTAMMLLSVLGAQAVSFEQLSMISEAKLNELRVQDPKTCAEFDKAFCDELVRAFDNVAKKAATNVDHMKVIVLQQTVTNLYKYEVSTSEKQDLKEKVVNLVAQVDSTVYPFRAKLSALSKAIISNASAETIQGCLKSLLRTCDEILMRKQLGQFFGNTVNRTYVEQFVNACSDIASQDGFNVKASKIVLDTHSLHVPYGVIVEGSGNATQGVSYKKGAVIALVLAAMVYGAKVGIDKYKEYKAEKLWKATSWYKRPFYKRFWKDFCPETERLVQDMTTDAVWAAQNLDKMAITVGKNFDKLLYTVAGGAGVIKVAGKALEQATVSAASKVSVEELHGEGMISTVVKDKAVSAIDKFDKVVGGLSDTTCVDTRYFDHIF